jgi:hypothetical protein
MMLRFPRIPGWTTALGTSDCWLGRADQARACFARVNERGLAWIHREPFVLSGLASIAGLCGLLRDGAAAQPLYAAIAPYADHHGLTHLSAATHGRMTR